MSERDWDKWRKDTVARLIEEARQSNGRISVYLCEQTGEHILPIESYDHVCEKWKYWNPNAKLNEKGEPDWNPHLGRRNCRGCRYRRLVHIKVDDLVRTDE